RAGVEAEQSGGPQAARRSVRADRHRGAGRGGPGPQRGLRPRGGDAVRLGAGQGLVVTGRRRGGAMERGMTADPELAALGRRKGLIGAIAAATFAVGAAVVVGLPSVYTASVVVRVEPQRPAEELVQRTVSEPIEQRLLTVRQELLARPVLEKAIQEMDLYP